MRGKASCLLVLTGGLLLASSLPLPAASTGTTSLHMPQGSAAGTAHGDSVSDGGGLNTIYR